MVLIPSGSFFLPDYLNKGIEEKTISKHELTIAVDLALPAAYRYKLNDLTIESVEWFYFAKKLARLDSEYALQLAAIYQIEDDSKASIFWYKKAIKLKHPKAATQLADYYISTNRLDEAKVLLQTHIDSAVSLSKLISIAITQGNIAYIQKYLPELYRLGETDLIEQVLHYRILTNKDLAQFNSLDNFSTFGSNHPSVACENNIQLLGSNLANLQHLKSLIKQVDSHPLADYFCFETPRYIPITQLDCIAEGELAIQCDESMWIEYEQTVNSRYLGLMLDNGGANVNKGILYLDKHDDVNVFTHELSHLLGFIDEYELSKKHVACQSVQQAAFAHNVVVLPEFLKGNKLSVLEKIKHQIPWQENIESNTVILTKVGNKWKIGTPDLNAKNHSSDIGLYPVDTCNKENIKAFKPLPQVTQLNYYEEDFPEFYASMLQNDPARFSMPSYHYNVAQALFNKGKDEEGVKWLSYALLHEDITSKKYHRIKRGGF